MDPLLFQEGSFVSKGVEYSMELLDERSNARVRRDVTSKLWGLAKNVVTAANEFSKVYGIFKTEKKAGTPSDFKEESRCTVNVITSFLISEHMFGISATQ